MSSTSFKVPQPMALIFCADVVISVATYKGYTETYGTESDEFHTYTREVIPATPVSAITTITESADYRGVTQINIVVASGMTSTYSYNPTRTTRTSELDTSFVVPITYKPLATCTSQNWTFTTNVPIYIPAIISLTPASLSTSATTYSALQGYNPLPTTEVFAILNPTDVDADDLASAATRYMPYGMTNCYTPTLYCPTASAAQCTTTFAYASRNSGSSGGSTDYSDYYNYYGYEDHWLRDIILIAVLIPVGWSLIWLIIGFWESWQSFKGLMLGKKRKRGLPYSWCCISIFFLCFTGPTYKEKGEEEQANLLLRWKAMKKREKFSLWLKWGFRWKYPDMLGPEPEVSKRALRQGCL